MIMARRELHPLLIALSLLVAAPALAMRLELPPPPDATVTWIAENMTLNGVAMQVRRFDTRRSVPEVLDFYRRLWAQPAIRGRSPFGEAAMGPWAIVTREQEGLLLSVHVMSTDRGCWGYLGVSNAPQLQEVPTLGRRFPKMRGSNVVNDIESSDAGSSGRTLLIANGYSVSSNAAFYRRHFDAKGWQKMFDHPSKNGVGHVLVYRDGPDAANVVIRSEGGFTYVTANVIRR
jgi:hypothetical protein